MLENAMIRPERVEDVEAIASVTEQAFRIHPISQQTEQFIVAALRRAGVLTVSLVVECDGQIVGHVAFSPVEFSDGSTDWYILGPISVVPELQRQGIGKALVHAGLDALRALDAQGCMLVGDPAYYERFGFRSRPDCSVDGVPQEFVLSLTLGDHTATGKVTHHEAFSATS